MYTFTTTKQIRLSVAFALTFIAIASLRITTQGLYYDEVHQATASFAYQGSPSKMFSAFDIAGFPVLNMPYSGAIKTSIYGIYLKFFGAKFSILSWRLTGIIIAGFGLLIFYINISNHLRPAAHSFLHFLIVTDMTILLTVRHDWGPVALSFFIRLLFIGIWIKFERIPPVSHWIPFTAGFLAGAAIYEKLSALALVPSFLYIISSSRERSQLKTVCWKFAFGGLIGASPLVFANSYSLFSSGSLISLKASPEVFHHSFKDIIFYAYNQLSLGSGTLASQFILETSDTVHAATEALSLSILLLITSLFSFIYNSNSETFRIPRIMLICYFITVFAIFIFPKKIWLHHWILATPYQYAALAFSAAPIIKQGALKDEFEDLI